jgi:hypothetical protein
MDKLLQPPDTPPGALVIEKRVRELADLVDPPEFTPSDAALDDAKWPSWGRPSSSRQEAQRILNEYLPGRREFLFKSPRAKLLGDPIPSAQPADAVIEISAIEDQLPPLDQSVCLTNQNDFAVDISGCQVKGCGIEHYFRPGTVIPSGRALYLTADAAQFRSKLPSPSPSRFVQGDWKGTLKESAGPLLLLNKTGKVVAQRELR